VADGAALAIFKIAELLTAGHFLPRRIQEFLPRLMRDKLWAEEAQVSASQWEAGEIYMKKGAHSARWVLEGAEI
jgi:hypothetical protein